jgi:hypothetical protein
MDLHMLRLFQLDIRLVDSDQRVAVGLRNYVVIDPTLGHGPCVALTYKLHGTVPETTLKALLGIISPLCAL